MYFLHLPTSCLSPTCSSFLFLFALLGSDHELPLQSSPDICFRFKVCRGHQQASVLFQQFSSATLQADACLLQQQNLDGAPWMLMTKKQAEEHLGYCSVDDGIENKQRNKISWVLQWLHVIKEWLPPMFHFIHGWLKLSLQTTTL